jgi:hypothetical protein
MFIEKLKLSGVALVLAAVGVISASSALLAYQASPARHQAPDPGFHTAAIAQAESPNSPGPTQGKPKVDAIAPHDEENKALEIEELRVEAELLEIEVAHLRAKFPVVIQSLAQLEYGPQYEGIPEEQRAEREKIERHWAEGVDRSRKRLENDKRSYREKRMKLVQLKRQIARESKALGEMDESIPSASDIVRRLDRLETKIDQLINVRAAKTKR